jgi:hypothetical protein
MMDITTPAIMTAQSCPHNLPLVDSYEAMPGVARQEMLDALL